MARIYSITSDKGDKVYIGSTADTLAGRKRQHKSSRNQCNSKILFDEYGFENCIFTVLEECEEEQRYEKERYHIEHTLNVVNKYIPARTKDDILTYNKEYSQRDIEKERVRAYREANRDILNEKAKAHYYKNIELARERANAYREKNREKLREKQRAYTAKKKSMVQ